MNSSVRTIKPTVHFKKAEVVQRVESKVDFYINFVLSNSQSFEQFIYLVRNNEDDPYDLSMVSYDVIVKKRKERATVKEYYTFSSRGICYYLAEKPVEYIALKG